MMIESSNKDAIEIIVNLCKEAMEHNYKVLQSKKWTINVGNKKTEIAEISIDNEIIKIYDRIVEFIRERRLYEPKNCI